MHLHPVIGFNECVTKIPVKYSLMGQKSFPGPHLVCQLVATFCRQNHFPVFTWPAEAICIPWPWTRYFISKDTTRLPSLSAFPIQTNLPPSWKDQMTTLIIQITQATFLLWKAESILFGSSREENLDIWGRRTHP